MDDANLTTKFQGISLEENIEKDKNLKTDRELRKRDGRRKFARMF